MHFYRPLRALRALTFDLDDTLYDNRPVIARTERESVLFLQRYHPALKDLDAGHFQRLRAELRRREPEIYHDVSQWRWRAVELAMLNQGLDIGVARAGADAFMASFARWRSDINVPDATHRTLSALAERWPLVAITNGNASPEACGLGGYFTFVLRAGPDGRAKPFRDMYHIAAEKLGLPPQSILHVGDDLTADVTGAISSGMQACWVNDRGGNFFQAPDARLLPHIEISQLASLTALL
ncbi:5-amino-6-(5-phospho-D-ribitylamino)uracil phosphatase YigB [Acerihabitans arboris]|uniref:5-amino-6-(5-phospho-D-ribitylamino)uracil phosphatase YigB n=1 Tax=Acerihabitans arboris TaxID=2691583 RepID=A0A845STP1_9GAMM|nr:5-amino-6-(5-phospho-D-ribitylamino)uracil phosphatase YigB [Acerihabitans arboris]NDL64415.1 5-amino-6-(5-phospho-D-ribitylamino)uracil phosphatase YigB [Acerihabitans arboris]